jgi:hypothetical protein
MKGFNGIRLVFISAAILLIGTAGVQAQKTDTVPGQYEIEVQKLVGAIVQKKGSGGSGADEQAGRMFSPRGTHTNVFGYALIMAIRPTREDYVKKVEEARIDKQVGSDSKSSGSTSLTAKASIPSILGFAVENGALQKDVNGTTMTFRGNWVGLIKALGDKGFIASYDDDDATTRFLRRASFAISFDTSRGQQPGTFTGSSQQISNYSFRFDVYNKRDPRNSSYTNKWHNLISDQGQALTQNLSKIVSFFIPLPNPDPNLTPDPNLVAWLGAAQSAVAAAKPEEVDVVVRKAFEGLRSVQLAPTTKEVIAEFEKNAGSYLEGRSRLLKEVANGPIVTFEFTNNRPGNQPNYSNFNFIGEVSPFHGRADLTTNVSFSIFDKKPVSATGTARDFQLSGQLDVPLGDIARTGPFVFTASGKYQHLFSDITTTGTPPTTAKKGNIGIGQFKLTIPVKGSGVKIPLSVTFSNRSELIKESRVRGNIGVTFDLDTIFSKVKP